MANPAIEKAVTHAVQDYINALDNPAEAKNVHSLIMKEAEAVMIKLGLQYNNGNQSEAAKWLGISRNTLKTKMVEYRLLDQFPPVARRKKRSL